MKSKFKKKRFKKGGVATRRNTQLNTFKSVKSVKPVNSWTKPFNKPLVKDEITKYIKIITTGETIISCESCKSFVNPIMKSNLAYDTNNWAFLFFLKRLIMQPFMREYFVKKYNPEMPYAMIKISYKDINKTKKLNFIDSLIKSNQDFILDLAIQFSEGGGGHYTSLKRENGRIEYMDSDSFVYGAAYGGEESEDRLSKMLQDIPNPEIIFGDDNKDNTSFLKAKRSIQNLHPSYDTFCQSWSLLFITLSKFIPDIHKQLNFQMSDYGIIEHYSYFDSLLESINEDEEMSENEKEIKRKEIDQRKSIIEQKENENFDRFIKNNFPFLLNFWTTLFNDNSINNLLQSQTLNQFKYWTSKTICDKLINIGIYLQEKKTKDIDEVNKTTFSFDVSELGKFMTDV